MASGILTGFQANRTFMAGAATIRQEAESVTGRH
jgi:hypothetical protein